MNTPPSITELRQALMNTLADLRNPNNPMDVDRAKAVAHVASVIVDSAKIEVEYIKACGGSGTSPFLDAPPEDQAPRIAHEHKASPLPNTIHRIRS